MSIQEMVDLIPKLSAEELDMLDERVREAQHRRRNQTLQQLMEEVAGKAENLPEDMADQHDHYLYGVPKR